MDLGKMQSALAFTFDKQRQYVIAIVIFVIVFLLYLIILPASSTGGQLSLVNLNYLSPQLGAFAFVMAIMLALIIPMNIKLRNSGQRTHKTGAVIGGAGGLVGSLLCCSYILPSLIALLGSILPSVTWLDGVQGFIATHEPLILLISLIVLTYAFLVSIRQLNHCPNCQIKTGT